MWVGSRAPPYLLMAAPSVFYPLFLLHLFDHRHNVLLLLGHHRNGSWFAVLANIPLSGKTKEEP